MPQSLCLTTARAARACRRRRPRGRTRSGASADERQLALHARAGCRRRPRTAVERNSIALPLQDLVVDRLLDARPVVVAERLHPAGALAHAQRGRVGVEREAACAGSSPTSSVACQAVTWIRRSCPALAAAPVRLVCTERVPLLGPERVRAAWIAMRGAYIGAR